MKSSTSKKINAQKAHFKKRFKERVGRCINRFERREIINKIENNKITFFKKQSNRVYLYKMFIDNNDYILFYDIIRKTLVTIVEYNKEDNFIFKGNYNELC